MIRLIVGLGNPGAKYKKTRHNVGFLLLDELAKNSGKEFVSQVKFHGHIAEINQGMDKLYLLKPSTFMNRSGQAVSSLMKYYKISAEEVLVVHDELDFEVGTLKVKKSGGHGGHNGLRDIIASLGTKEFSRIRIGIDRPAAGKNVADYVLSDFSKSDLQSITALFDYFEQDFPIWFNDGYDAFVQQIHSH